MSGRDERIASLAATLKTSGIAKSEAQARMMAEEMIGVEENVQKRYDEEHTRAHEFLQTAKHLGQPMTRKAAPQAETKPAINQEVRPAMKIAPLPDTRQASTPTPAPVSTTIAPVSAVSVPPEPKPVTQDIPRKEESSDNFPKFIPGKIAPVHTDVSFGGGSLKDLMLSQIESDHHEVKALEDMVPVKPVQKPVIRETHTETPPVQESSNLPVDEAKSSVQQLLDEIGEEMKEMDDDHEQISGILDTSETVESPMGVQESLEDVKSEDVKSEAVEEIHEETVPEPTSAQKEEPQLDSKKLQEMMEEDGPMEEHTREIKEKPKDAKPKDEYVENSIDLSDMFNVNKK